MKKHLPEFSHADWLGCALDPKRLRQNIKIAVKSLKKQGFKFEAFAFRGMSGAMLAAPLAMVMGKTLIMVRKEPSHSLFTVEGDRAAKHYVIVDDFVVTGKTVSAIIDGIKSEFNADAKCIGILELCEDNHKRNREGYLKLRSPNRYAGKRLVNAKDTEKYYEECSAASAFRA
jgi:adenine/guanine phosphoribosyltransferase-like PRPP-binding protein